MEPVKQTLNLAIAGETTDPGGSVPARPTRRSAELSVPRARVADMGRKIQIVIDCADPDRLATFWASALDYEIETPPDGSATWADYWRKRGLPEEEIGESIGNDRIVDGDGTGPRFWFQQVPEGKIVKNRLHLDITVSGGRATPFAERKKLVELESERLQAMDARVVLVHDNPGFDHFGITMQDPEGNEFCLI
jgi:hypothetical protein